MNLSDKEIVTFFNTEFPNVKLDIPSLRVIQRETVEECLIVLLSVIYGLDEDFFRHDEHNPQRRLIMLVSLTQRAIDDLDKDVGICFTVSDLISPKSSRIRIFLGLLIGFYKFVNQQNAFIDDVFNEVNTFEAKEGEIQQSVDNLQIMYDRELEFIEQNERVIEELMDIHFAESAEIDELTAKKMELKAEALRCEENVISQKATIAKLESTVEELVIESENLSDQIITSPEQLFGDIAHCESELKQTKESISMLKRQCREQDRLKHEVEVLREKCRDIHALITAIIKANLDKVSEARAEEAESAELLKQKQDLVAAMEREHNEFREHCENLIRTIRDNIKVTEEKIQSVLRQNETYLKNAEELETLDFAAEEKAKIDQLKKIREATAHLSEEAEGYLSRCLIKENNCRDKIIDAQNQYIHMVNFVDKCVNNVHSHPTIVEINKAIDYLAALENRKKELLKQ